VQKWYSEGSDFHEGVMLLQEAGADVQAFLPYLTESYIPKAKQELLTATVLSLPADRQVFEFRVFDQATQNPKPENQKPTEHPTITQLRSQARTLHKLHADRHAQLHATLDDAERLDLIVEIMETIIPSLDSIYDSIRVYEKTGALPEIRHPESENQNPTYATGLRDGVQKFQRLQNLKSRISKLDGKNGLIEKEKDGNRKAKLQQELAEKLKERDALSLELNLTEEHD
jgi:hypothetical protein